MKVVDRNLNSGSAVESGRAQETQRVSSSTGSAATTQPGSGGDRVEFSNALGSLARAMSTFSANAVSKVQSLAAQYQSGAYQANSAATSGAMIAQALAAPGDE
jgi:hypothetical protein